MAKRQTQYHAEAGPDGPGEPAGATQESSVYARGQTVIPKAIREALGIEYGARLHWELREGVIHVIPIPQNPVQALRGALKGSGITYEWFMQQRQINRQRERAQERQWEQEYRARPGRGKRPRGSS